VKVREIFRYEVAYRLRSVSTWIYAAILLLLGNWMFLATSRGPGFFNAPERLAEGSILVSIFGMLVSAALFGDAAVRDAEVEMQPLLFTTPVSKTEYLGGRFLGTLAVNALVLLAIPLGILVVTLMAPSLGRSIGPIRFAAHLEPYFLFLLPNLILVGAVLFTIGILARHVVPVYLAAFGLFVGYIVALNYASQIDNALLAGMVDPLGMVTLQRISKYWTEAERNARLIGVPAALVWNRVLWLAAAAAVLLVLHHRFRFAHLADGRRRRTARRAVVAPGSTEIARVKVPRVVGSFGFRTTMWQTLAVARRTLAEVASGRWFVVVLLACTSLTMLWGWNVAETVFDTSTWPVTLLVIQTVLSQRITLLPYVLIALYAGELVWREREVGEAGIAGALPVPEGTALLGRFFALVAIIAMFQAACMVGGMLIQALQGYYHFELGLYLRVVFGLNLADYVILAALAMTIHVIVNQKYLGHIFVLLAFLLSRFVLSGLGLVRHHLLLYGTDPGWTYSDMNGFGPFAEPLVWFKLYWSAWAFLLLILALLLWVRGQELGVRDRLRRARARFIGPVARAAAVATALILMLGGFVFYNTNIVNEYRPPNDSGARQAKYEKRYKRFEHAPQPVMTSADLRVEIYPERPAAELRGGFQLVNQTSAPIDSVHVSFMEPKLSVRSLSFGRGARQVLADDDAQYRIFALDRPLEPGDSLRLDFNVAFQPRGFPNNGIQTEVVGNGSSFNRRFLPIIGYQPALELSDEDARRRFGLGRRAPMPGPNDADARRHRWTLNDADLVSVNAVVGTSADQIALTPDLLRRSWTENGRRYFHYQTGVPGAFGGTFFSARYAELADRWTPSDSTERPVDLRIYYHRDHTYNLDRTLRSMKASLDYYTEQFGPYPYSLLRVVEVPRYGGLGVAHPQTIAFTEDYFFSRVRQGEVDQPFYGAAHEIAHSWWGGMVRGAAVRGAEFLSESLANYSAMMVTEKTYGRDAGRSVYGFQLDRYLRGRASQSHEVPVLDVETQPYISYRKGAIAMFALREYIGEARVNGALRRYLAKYRDAGPPYPTSRDLYAELRAATPDSLQYLLTDLFETVTLWDLRADRARVEPTGTGEYRVTIDVQAKKVRADSVGKETPVPMSDFVQIGVFAADSASGAAAPLYLQWHRIRSGKQTIQITVPRKPARAGIDPYHWLIDRESGDNVVEVHADGG
jgi:ABC-2 type transport system permease protein